MLYKKVPKGRWIKLKEKPKRVGSYQGTSDTAVYGLFYDPKTKEYHKAHYGGWFKLKRVI
jgi:hypothetical protein